MKRVLTAFAALLMFGGLADSAEACVRCLANQKAQIAASRGLRGQHVGGSLGGGRYEGVGWSTQSPDQAVRVACYWGRKTPIAIGVARGRDGWYSCVIYR